jgi:hypothetical protein
MDTLSAFMAELRAAPFYANAELDELIKARACCHCTCRMISRARVCACVCVC